MWHDTHDPPALWPALADLFGENGACGGGWCMDWRIGVANRKRPGADNKAAFREVVERGLPPGPLAFAGETAVLVPALIGAVAPPMPSLAEIPGTSLRRRGQELRTDHGTHVTGAPRDDEADPLIHDASLLPRIGRTSRGHDEDLSPMFPV